MESNILLSHAITEEGEFQELMGEHLHVKPILRIVNLAVFMRYVKPCKLNSWFLRLHKLKNTMRAAG